MNGKDWIESFSEPTIHLELFFFFKCPDFYCVVLFRKVPFEFDNEEIRIKEGEGRTMITRRDEGCLTHGF